MAAVGDLAFGRAPLDGFWGDRPCVDSLRLRLARSDSAARGAGRRIGLEGFYRWAGPRLGPEELGRLPAELVPDAAAALAAVSGYRRAFELLAARAASPTRAARRSAPAGCSRSAARSRGLFFPALVRFLLPSAEQRLDEPPSPAAWEPAMLALHAYRLAGHEAGTTHVAAAIVSTIVRDQIGRIGRRSLPAYRPREWGALRPRGRWRPSTGRWWPSSACSSPSSGGPTSGRGPRAGARPTRSRSSGASPRPWARAAGRPTTSSSTTAWPWPHATRFWATPRALARPWPRAEPPTSSSPRAIVFRARSNGAPSTGTPRRSWARRSPATSRGCWSACATPPIPRSSARPTGAAPTCAAGC